MKMLTSRDQWKRKLEKIKSRRNNESRDGKKSKPTNLNDEVCKCAMKGYLGPLDEVLADLTPEEINKVVHEVNKEYGVSPIVAACENNYPEIIEYFIEEHQIQLIPSSDQKRLKHLLDGKRHLSNNLSVFGVAAFFDQIRIIEFLLERNVNINTGLEFGSEDVVEPPLHAAVVNDQRNTVKFLVQRGADLSITDAAGNNCLMMIDFGMRSAEGMLKLLVGLGAQVDLPNPLDGHCFLQLQCRSANQKRLLKYLVEVCSEGNNPSTHLKNRQVAQQLWKKHPDSWTPNDHIEFLELSGARYVLTISESDRIRNNCELDWVIRKCWKRALKLRIRNQLPKKPDPPASAGLFASVEEHASYEDLKILRKQKDIEAFRLQALLIISRVSNGRSQFSYREFLALGMIYRKRGDFARCFSVYGHVLQKARLQLGPTHAVTLEILASCYKAYYDKLSKMSIRIE